MIKAIIFDFYGVIRSDEYHDWLKYHQLSKDPMKNVSKKLGEGLITMDKFFETLSQISHIPAENIRQEFKSNASLNKELLNLIIDLKKEYKIAILSNASSPYLRETLKNAGIDRLFDEVVISSDVGYIKPSEVIFIRTLEKLGVKAEETLFIDDNASFVEAAQALGMKGINFISFDSLLTKLRENGIVG